MGAGRGRSRVGVDSVINHSGRNVIAESNTIFACRKGSPSGTNCIACWRLRFRVKRDLTSTVQR